MLLWLLFQSGKKESPAALPSRHPAPRTPALCKGACPILRTGAHPIRYREQEPVYIHTYAVDYKGLKIKKKRRKKKPRWRNAILRLLAPLGAALARRDGLSPKLCRSGPGPPAPTLSLSPQGTSLYALWNVGVTSCPHTCARSLQFGPFLLPPGVRRTMASARHDHSTLLPSISLVGAYFLAIDARHGFPWLHSPSQRETGYACSGPSPAVPSS